MDGKNNYIKTIFKHGRIAGLPSMKNTGKTNNLAFMLQQLRLNNEKIDIFIYGFPDELANFLKKTLNVKVVCSLKQIKRLNNCLLVCDEFQKLKLNDRRYRDDLEDFVAQAYHNNIYVLLSTPNIREFNSVIGSIIEVWCLKTITSSSCVNGSQLKNAVMRYKGTFKVGKDIVTSCDVIVIDGPKEEIVLKCDYVVEADTKKKLAELF